MDAIIADIENAKKKKASISSRLVKFFLGKETGFNDQKEVLEEKIKRINAIQDEVGQNVATIDEEDRKVKIADAIEQLEKDIEGENEKLQQEKQKLVQKQSESYEKRKEIHSLFLQNKEAALEESIEKLRGEAAKLEKLLEDKKQTLANLEAVNGQKEQEKEQK